MTGSDWIALSAWIPSVLLSLYLYHKDRGRLRAQAILNYGDPSERFPPVFEIHVVNVGRRIILLSWLLLDFKRTSRHGTQLADAFPLKLDKGELFERRLHPTESCLFDDMNDYANDIHVSDTLGRAFCVKDARKLLREYQRIYKNEIEQ
jgi:hypothetical protein